MTAHAMQGDRERCLSAGMDDYVSKPIRTNELADALLRVMRPPEPSADPTTCQSPGTPAEHALDVAAIDWQRALAHTEGDRELLRDLAQVLFEEGPTMVDELVAASAAADGVRLRRAAHTIKGSLGYFGLEHLQGMAWELEQMGRDNRCAEAPDICRQLVAGFQRLYPALQEFIQSQSN